MWKLLANLTIFLLTLQFSHAHLLKNTCIKCTLDVACRKTLCPSLHDVCGIFASGGIVWRRDCMPSDICNVKAYSWHGIASQVIGLNCSTCNEDLCNTASMSYTKLSFVLFALFITWLNY